MLSDTTNVERIQFSLASSFLEEHELLGDIGLGVWHWGLFEKGELSSVVSFGTTGFSSHRGFISSIAESAGCRIIQLCRGARAPFAHKHAASYLISKACQLMYKQQGPLIIVAYANAELGEIGTIYQAANAIYTGMTDPKGQANYVINGRKMNGWMVRKVFGTRSLKKLRKVASEIKVFPLQPKHRYVFLACSDLKKKQVRTLFSSYLLPYPKRDHTQVI